MRTRSSTPPRPPIVTFAGEDPASHSIRAYRRSTRAPIVHVEGLHTHTFFVLFYVDRGLARMRFARGEIELRSGDLHVLFPGELHAVEDLGGLDGWVVEFTEDALNHRDGVTDVFGAAAGRARWARCLRKQEATRRVANLPCTRRAFADGLCAELVRALADKPIGHRDTARASLQLLLLELVRDRAAQAVERPRHALVEEALSVIDAHYTGAVSLAHVARAVGRSSAHLAQTMKAHTGKTVLEWIAERRLDDARRRLRETDENIQIIGERVGYGSTNQFIRQFRRVHGVSPGQWRRGHHVAA